MTGPAPSGDLLDLAGYEPPGIDPAAKWTERMMLDLLRARYLVSGGNGPRYAYAEHVKSMVGHDAPRCADAIAMSLWGSDDMALHGHEVKVSRADWLTELKHPEKADAFRPFMDYWWLVVPDTKIVRDDLPDGWGLLAPTKAGRLRIVKRAPRRRSVDPMPKAMQACLLRATAKTARRALAADELTQRYLRDHLTRQGRPSPDQEAVALMDTIAQAVRW